MNNYDTGRRAEVTGLDQVTTAADLADVITQMRRDLAANPTAWENHTLGNYLEALAAFLQDTPRLRGDTQPETTWNTVAYLLVCATGYE